MWAIWILLTSCSAAIPSQADESAFLRPLELAEALAIPEREVIARTREWIQFSRSQWRRNPEALLRLGRNQFWALHSVCPVREECAVERDPSTGDLLLHSLRANAENLDSWIERGMEQEAAWRKSLQGPLPPHQTSNESERRIATSLEQAALVRLLSEEAQLKPELSAAWVDSLPQVPLHLDALTQEEFGALFVHLQSEITLQTQAAALVSELGADDPEFLDWAQKLRSTESSWPRDGARLKTRYLFLRDSVIPSEHFDDWTRALIAQNNASPGLQEAISQILIQNLAGLEITTWTESWLRALFEELSRAKANTWRAALERGYNAPFLDKPPKVRPSLAQQWSSSLKIWQKWGKKLHLDSGLEEFEGYWKPHIDPLLAELRSESSGILRNPQVMRALTELHEQSTPEGFQHLQDQLRQVLRSSAVLPQDLASLRCAYASSARFTAVLRTQSSHLLAAQEALKLSCTSPSFRDRLIGRMIGWYLVPGLVPLGLTITGWIIRPLRPWTQGIQLGLAPLIQSYLRGVLVAAVLDSGIEGYRIWNQRGHLAHARAAQELQTGPGWLSARGLDQWNSVLRTRSWWLAGKLALDSLLMYIPETLHLLRPVFRQAALARRMRIIAPDIEDFVRLDLEPGRWNKIWSAYEKILTDPSRAWSAKAEARAAAERLQEKIRYQKTW